MANLLYHWNFTGNYDLNSSINETNESAPIYDSKSNVVAKVKRRLSGETGETYSNSSVSIDNDGITFNNNDSTNGGYYIDLEGLDTVNLGGAITIEMVVKNIKHDQDTVYFQSIREFIDENGDTLDDNLGIVTSGFNNNSAFLKLFYKQDTETKMQVRTDSRVNSTSKDGRVTYFLKNATSGTALNSNEFHHYLVIIDKDGTNSSKTIQLFIDGSEAGSTTANLEKELSDAVRQYNAIGTQKNPIDATYLKGTVKYLKIYDNTMTSSRVTEIYNSYNFTTTLSDYSSATDSEKYDRRHSSINDYFDTQPNISSFTMTGNKLGLLNLQETYNIHKFTNGDDIDVSSGYHYVPLSGINNYIIFKNDTTWYKITQTSGDNGVSTTYKYEISTNSGGSYGAAVTGKTFGESFSDGNITIAFGGAESGKSGSHSVSISDNTIRHVYNSSCRAYMAFDEQGSFRLKTQLNWNDNTVGFALFDNGRLAMDTDTAGEYTLNIATTAFLNNGEINFITQESDERLKINIKSIRDSSKILQIQPVQYNWKHSPEGGLHYGFIAQDLQDIYPNLVDINNNHYSINYIGVVPLMVDQIKRQTREVDELTKRIKDLEDKQ